MLLRFLDSTRMYPLILTLRKAFVVLCATSFVCTSSEETVNHEGRLSSPEDVLQSFRYTFYPRSEYPKDCRDVQRQCSTSSFSGVYLIKPDGYKEPFEVFCNNDVDTGGWTVIFRRLDGSVNFTRSWSEYKDGFGFLSTELWLGNEKFSHLTNLATYELRLDVELSNGASFYVLYNGFRVSDERNEYKITFAGHFESNAESLITACPPNMVYEMCSCQTTCEDPKGESGCHSDCIGSESCVCPTGFLMHGSDCTSASECGCFVPEVNFVVPNGELYINDRCTQKCSCNNNQLTCAVYSCSTDAVCNVKNGVRKCYCNAGYEGNGETCTTSSTDCKDVYDSGRRQDGVYTILPSRWPGLPFNVKCKMDNGGGWTVFQRRNHGSTSFHRNWASYKNGFGNHNEDFWLGNEKLHYLTTQKDYKLRFDVITSRGWRKYAEYAEFEVRSENDKYRMSKLGAHSGDTGDYLVARNRGKYFSTYDRDNDACGNFNCAEKHRSGWWHSNTYCSYCYGSYCSRFQYRSSCHTECTADNLNGDYNGGNGENIMSHHSGDNCYVGSVEMKIRPRL
ncbi:uncharacterized protein [Apostichopus japonicus]|uniref:uncharacterized protein n=1 Tax=Stichopus japonicus TaxID=307972 RepID=UPI003AB151D5